MATFNQFGLETEENTDTGSNSSGSINGVPEKKAKLDSGSSKLDSGSEDSDSQDSESQDSDSAASFDSDFHDAPTVRMGSVFGFFKLYLSLILSSFFQMTHHQNQQLMMDCFQVVLNPWSAQMS